MNLSATVSFLASGFGLGCAATAAQQTLAPSLSIPAQVSLGGALFALGAWTLNFASDQIKIRDAHLRDSNALMLESSKGLSQTAEAIRGMAAEQAAGRRSGERIATSVERRLAGIEEAVKRVEKVWEGGR